MMWDEWDWVDNSNNEPHHNRTHQEYQDSHVNFDFLSLLSKPKDYYKILEVDYDATEDAIRSNYIRLALKWHPDKQKEEDCATSRFQEINEAYQEGDAEGFLDTNFIHKIGTREGQSESRVQTLEEQLLVFKALGEENAETIGLSQEKIPVEVIAPVFDLILSDPVKRREYDSNGMLHVYDYNIIDYLNRYKGLILTCNGLGMRNSIL
ncbi:hypothetical protein EZV62_021866 [Acer yangbiense]|uniref:J domain-containing protein n=1 Tax=Acer yangbiense TaxID=1000413 RepID=A0A5C7H6X6_9ROSI|nr:hypothetical protein EZV62_021866 [Acer yangbiense]